MSASSLQPVIGLEVHCQLLTDTRLFSAGPATYGERPNSRVTPYDIGLPGTLPVVNRRAVDLALRAGVALNCTIHSESRFDRKHYFYPDLPKGYQITQYDRPICTGGRLKFDVDGQQRQLALRRIHLEEDAAKSIHGADGASTLVDFNRAGAPLIEIVTEPDLAGPGEAEAALRALHQLVVHLGICDGNMQEGSFRCDANVSLCRPGVEDGRRESVGPRVELKNLNSFRFVRRALEAEIGRLRRVIERDDNGPDETRRYDPDGDRTVLMRTKETSPDYRYLPDPDLPPLRVDYRRIQQVRDGLGELPRQRQRRYVEQFGLSADDATTLVDPPVRATFFDRAVQAYPDNSVGIANFIVNEVLAKLDGGSIGELDVTAKEIARIVQLTDEGTISSSSSVQVLDELVRSDESPDEIVERLELRQLGDRDELQALVDQVLAENPKLVDRYRNGEQKLFGHFMGQVMRASSGRADPKIVTEVLRDRL